MDFYKIWCIIKGVRVSAAVTRCGTEASEQLYRLISAHIRYRFVRNITGAQKKGAV